MRYKEEFVSLLDEMEKRYQKANEKYATCMPGALVRDSSTGKERLFHIIREDGVRKRRVITDNDHIIGELFRKKYIETELKLLSKDIKALKRFINIYDDFDADNIIANMPDRYSRISEKYICSDIACKHNLMQWAEAPFEQSTYEPKEKIHKTSRGIKVRTKSEVIVAEKLDASGIPYRYEEMLYIESFSFAPDFTIMTENGLWYWEHAGRVDNPSYIRRHKWKMNMYEKAGIFPWKNLIVTYDDENGALDSRIIAAEINNKLL